MDVQLRGTGGLSAGNLKPLGGVENLTRLTGDAAITARWVSVGEKSAQAVSTAGLAGSTTAATGGLSGQTLFDAQMIGQSAETARAAESEAAAADDAPGATGAPETTGASSGEVTASDDDTGWSAAEQAFMDFMSMTPAERYRQMFLADEGLTEEDLAAMSPEERAKIETKIRERIEAAVKDQTTEGVGDTASANGGAAPQASAAAGTPPPEVAGADAVPGTGGPGDALGFGDGSDLDEMIRLAMRA